MDKLYTLLGGHRLTGVELTEMYKNNLHGNELPVAGYFCPICFHEMLDIGPDIKCSHCLKKEN